MACRYFYKGHQFDNEFALDDFLLEKLPFEPKLGDMVFERTVPLLKALDIIDEAVKEAEKARLTLNDMKKAGKIEYGEDGEIIFGDPPYIGVNKYLSGLTNSEGILFFPEFRKQDYWDGRFAHWKQGEFTEDEIAEFGLDKDNLPTITNTSDLNTYMNMMLARWKAQGLSGNAIHDVMDICFRKNGDDYNFNRKTDDLVNDIISNNMIDSRYRDYIKEDTIRSLVLYAKKLNNQLVNLYGEDCLYFPEIAITLDTNDAETTKLMGIIDLLVIDKNGVCHIIDYKTSTHDYVNFSDAKKAAYNYQLATYQRMLLRKGLNVHSGTMMIAPIKLNNFGKDDEGKYTYSNLTTPANLLLINYSGNTAKMWRNISEFLPDEFKVSLTTLDALLITAKQLAEWCPDYTSERKMTREECIDMLKKYNALKPNENGQYIWRTEREPITSTSEAEFVDKVLKYELSRPSSLIYLTGTMKNALRTAINNQDINAGNFPKPSVRESGKRITNITDLLSHYCNGAWEIVDNELLETRGVITVKTIDGVRPKQIEFIRVTNNNLLTNYRDYLDKSNFMRNRKLLTGKYESDLNLKSRQGSLMLEAVNGNIELMETMLLINLMDGLDGYVIGNISIINPRFAESLRPSNEELLYCWQELNRHSSVTNDKFKKQSGLKDPKIRFATWYELALNEARVLEYEGKINKWTKDYDAISLIRPCINNLDESINKSAEDKLRALRNLDAALLNATKPNDESTSALDKMSSYESSRQSKEAVLHTKLLMAQANLRGINFRQQLRDHDTWCQSVMIWKNGLSGTMYDNPGNLDNATLNLITLLLTEAYQNVRDDLLRDKVTISKLVKDLKEYHNMGYVKENTVGNLASLYSNMVEITSDGDFLFKNPNRLLGAEKAFLDYALKKINRNRRPDLTDEQLQQLQDNDDIEYYRVPLTEGGLDSQLNEKGLVDLLKSKFRFLNPKIAKEAIEKGLDWVLNGTDQSDERKSELMFKMTNTFDRGERDTRLDTIKEIGIENLEHNLEALLYKHLFAYSVEENIDKIFPMIKAAYIHIATQGILQNNSFDMDINYFRKYMKAKIFNQSIEDPRMKVLTGKLGELRSIASKMTLAFAPVQFIYQSLQGLWVDVSLMIRKPDGKQSFTFEHFKKALRIAWGDAFHYSDKPTLCSAINELYALNDMDMNAYAERISQSKKGIFDFWGFALKCTTRPDFYNRSTIFLCQMMGDGCYEAHSIDKNGRLIYDWTKDKRFDAFAKGNTSDPRYNLQRSLYYAIAKQFEAEGAKNADGTEFVLNMEKPMALPRAYTSKLAESMKSLADDIYGYYSHEKKSLIHSTWMGAMWMQFKTFWSGKKNQYLQSGGVRLRGNWEQLEINGEKQYYTLKEDGTPDYEGEFTSEDTGAPVMQWKGQWQEGIILTLSDLFRDSVNDGFKDAWENTWNNVDPNLRTIYLSNIKQAIYDISLWALGGGLIAGLIGQEILQMKDETRKDHDFLEGLGVSAANIAYLSVKNSFLDFNIYDTIGSPFYNWQPFAFNWTNRLVKNWWNVAMGDKSFWDGVVRTSSAAYSAKPFFDAIKPEELWTVREGGTYNKKENK